MPGTRAHRTHNYPPTRKPKQSGVEKTTDILSAGPTDPTDNADELLAALPADQRRFTLVMLSARSIRGGARQCGIPLRTAYRWFIDPQVKAAYAACQRRMHRRAFDQIAEVVGEAVGVLRRRLATGSVKAAAAVLDAVGAGGAKSDVKPLTIGDLRRQLDEVREQAEQRGLLRPKTAPVVTPPAPPTPPGTPAATP